MTIDCLIQPPATWKPYLPPAPRPPPKPRPSREQETDWADLAAQEKWADAIIAYLKVNWRGKHLMWKILNMIVAESRPETRSRTRSAAREALDEMMKLIQERRIMRHRRRWVAALELPAELPPSGSETGCTISERSQSAGR